MLVKEVLSALLFFSCFAGSLSECPIGWIRGPDSCYFFHQQAMTWKEASHYCRYQEAYLAKVESESERQFISAAMTHQIGSYWLDGVDDVIEGDWRWESTFEKINPTFWAPHEPNNLNGDEDCILTDNAYHGYWNDVSCVSRLYPLCEKPANSGETVIG